MGSFWKRIRPRTWILLGCLAIFLIFFWFRFLREVPNVHSRGAFDNDALKYGSIGVETTLQGGFPLDIWRVLPIVFPDYLPTGRAEDGYTAFGFIQEKGKELPVGFSRTFRGMDLVGINCAICHTGTYRVDFGSTPVVVPGAAAITQDPEAYLRFLFRCANDPRFNPDRLIAAIKSECAGTGRRLRKDEELILRAFIPFLKLGLKGQAEQYAWSNRNPTWGPGRIDPFNPVRFGMLKLPVDSSIGNSDMMPIWDMGNRLPPGARLHWDGLNGSMREVLVSSALGDGTSPRTLDLHRIGQLEDYLKTLPVPQFPGEIDHPLADRGKRIYDKACHDCHGPGGSKTGTVIKISLNPADEGDDRIATDPERVFMWNQASADRYNLYSRAYQWQFFDFENHDGYVSVPLTGLWMRGPYLHNGSVPTLWHLLHPEDRPPLFYRGCDVLEFDQVGFVWDRPSEPGRPYFRYDTGLRGNTNGGHLYGSDLLEDEKTALIEYLKTL